MHLTQDQLYHLAELSYDFEGLNTKEEQQLDHVKLCRECFNQYCVLATAVRDISSSEISTLRMEDLDD